MSSKVTKMAKDMDRVEAIKEKVVSFKVTYSLDTTLKYSIVTVTGVPEKTSSDDPLVKQAAEQQFVNTINMRLFLETYATDQDHRSDYPTFINLTKVESIKVKAVERIE